jgi:hypothetical protein
VRRQEHFGQRRCIWSHRSIVPQYVAHQAPSTEQQFGGGKWGVGVGKGSTRELSGAVPPPSPPRKGEGFVGRGRTVSREESAATSAGHSPCLREINVPDGRRSPLPSPDTVVCQKRVARHLAFCPTPAPATIRYGVPLVRTANPATLSKMGEREVPDGRFASTGKNRTAGKGVASRPACAAEAKSISPAQTIHPVPSPTPPRDTRRAATPGSRRRSRQRTQRELGA